MCFTCVCVCIKWALKFIAIFLWFLECLRWDDFREEGLFCVELVGRLQIKVTRDKELSLLFVHGSAACLQITYYSVFISPPVDQAKKVLYSWKITPDFNIERNNSIFFSQNTIFLCKRRLLVLFPGHQDPK